VDHAQSKADNEQEYTAHRLSEHLQNHCGDEYTRVRTACRYTRSVHDGEGDGPAEGLCCHAYKYGKHAVLELEDLLSVAVD
jgi:hypothetical protein